MAAHAPFVEAYHGYAMGTTSVGDLKETSEWQVACAKENLQTSDFYATPSKEVTIAFWTRFDGALDLNSWWGISSAANANLFRVFTYAATADVGNKIEFVQMDGGYFSTHDNVTDDPHPFNYQEWNHFAYVREAGADGHGFINVNGIERANSTNAGVDDIVMASGSQFCNMCFGAYSQLFNAITRERSSVAVMDDFYFITKAMTPAQIQAMYSDSRLDRSLPLDPSVKIHYDFDTFEGLAGPGPAEVVNLGSLGAKYNLVLGRLGGNATVTDTVAKKDITLYNPKFTASQNAKVVDMGLSPRAGLVVAVNDGLQQLNNLLEAVQIVSLPNEVGPSTGDANFPDSVGMNGNGILTNPLRKKDPVTGSFSVAQKGDVVDKDNLYVEVSWDTVPVSYQALGKQFSFAISSATYGTAYIRVMEGTSAPVPAWSNIEVVEDGTVEYVPFFADKNVLRYTVTVDSIADGTHLQYANGTNVTVGTIINDGFKSLKVTPPSNYQGLLEDALCFSATNENNLSTSTSSCANLTAIPFNDVPEVTSTSIVVDNAQNYTIDIGALVNDADADVTSIAITKLPTRGKLFMSDGTEILQEFRLNELASEFYQPVQEVLNISSFYSYGSHRWHAIQVVGERDVYVYGDSDKAWCPKTKLGTGISVDRDAANTRPTDHNTSYYYGPFNHDAAFLNYGFTEYIEVKFAKPVYPTKIEIGMPRGMGSVASVWSMSAYGESRPTGESGPDRKWIRLFKTTPDEGIQKESAKFNQYYVYYENVCNLAEKVDTLRVELDTRTVEDWNEIDYIYLYGTDDLPVGVLPYNDQQLIYMPNPHAWGEDEIKFNAYDCAYNKYSKAVADAAVILDVSPSPTNVGIIDQVATTPQVRSYEQGSTFKLLPFIVDPAALNPSRKLTLLSLPSSAHFETMIALNGLDSGLVTGNLPLQIGAGSVMPSTNSSIAVKAYTCNVNNLNDKDSSIRYEYADVVSGKKVIGNIKLNVPCLPDLSEPCSAAHWSFSVGNCDSKNTRAGSYRFSTGSLYAPKALCCNALNEDPRVCPTGGVLPAAFSVECDHIVMDSVISIVFMCLALVFITVLIAFIACSFLKQFNMMAGQAMFLVTCNLGGILGLSTILIYPGEWTTSKCRLLVALPSLAFTTIFTSMVLKAWRIDAIFNNKTLLAARIGVVQVFTRFAYIMSLDLILIILFIFVNDVHQTSHYKSVDGRQISFSECTTDGVYMGYILLLYKFLLLMYGVFLAVRVRKVSQDLSETKYIVYSIYSVAIVGIMGIYLYLFSDLDTEPAFTAFAICVLLVFTMPPCFMMTPRLLELLFPEERPFNASHTATNIANIATGKDFALTTKGDAWIDKVKGEDNEQLLNMLAEQQEEIRMLKVALEQHGYAGASVHPVSIKKMMKEKSFRDNNRITLSSSENRTSTGPTLSRNSLHFEGSQIIDD